MGTIIYLLQAITARHGGKFTISNHTSLDNHQSMMMPLCKKIATINIHIVNIIIKAAAYTMNQYLPLLSNPCVNSCPTITPIAP